jgi:hypothetical protein
MKVNIYLGPIPQPSEAPFMVNMPSSEDIQNGLETALKGILLDITRTWTNMTYFNFP